LADIKYTDYEDMYPDTVIIRREGYFYMVRGLGAIVCHHFFTYKCWKSGEGVVSMGFSGGCMEKVCQKLKEESISYLVLARGEVKDGESFNEKNRFTEFINTDTSDIPYREKAKPTRARVVTTSSSFLSDDERKLCDISIKYMERMISGHHPVNNSELDDDTVVSNENVQKCFGFVLDILKRVSSEPEKPAEYAKSAESVMPVAKKYELKPDYKDLIEQAIRDEEVRMSKMEPLMNECAKDIFVVKPEKISSTRLSNWLVDNGYLISVEDDKGNRHREASEKGKSIGMTNNLVQYNETNSYIQYRFTSKAQRFVFENLAEIANYKRKKS